MTDQADGARLSPANPIDDPANPENVVLVDANDLTAEAFRRIYGIEKPDPSFEEDRAVILNAIAAHSSPTVGRGDDHGGQRGFIVYDGDGLPFITAALRRHFRGAAVVLALGFGLLVAPPADAADVSAIVERAAARHGVPSRIAHAIASFESGYRCSARGRHGERGAMQIKPATARSVGVSGNLFDCETGIEAGMRYLKLALSIGGRGCAGVSLYNRGVGARPVCTAYGRKILGGAS